MLTRTAPMAATIAILIATGCVGCADDVRIPMGSPMARFGVEGPSDGMTATVHFLDCDGGPSQIDELRLADIGPDGIPEGDIGRGDDTTLWHVRAESGPVDLGAVDLGDVPEGFVEEVALDDDSLDQAALLYLEADDGATGIVAFKLADLEPGRITGSSNLAQAVSFDDWEDQVAQSNC